MLLVLVSSFQLSKAQKEAGESPPDLQKLWLLGMALAVMAMVGG